MIGVNIGVGYFLFIRKSPPASPATPAATPLTERPTPTIDETTLIKQAVYRLTGLDEIRAEITINRNTGRHAIGTIKEFEAVGGAYWLAAKVVDGWVGVYAGQANPTCLEIAPYDFPPEMVLECLDERGEVVGR